MKFPWLTSTDGHATAAGRLRWRMVGAMLLASAVPFVFLGSGAWLVFRRLAIEQTLASHRTMARAHAAALEVYLAEQLHTVELLARVVPREELQDPQRLQAVFDAMTSVHRDAFTDLGIIDASGAHLAYVGPYDLLGRDYSQADWFQAVMVRGSIVSDVFLGYRQVPHSVIAVRANSPAGPWIVRATLDNRGLHRLVRSLEVGTEGDVFLVNREGLYQTPARNGGVLEPSGILLPPPVPEVHDRRVRSNGKTLRQAMTWINDGQWLLVVQQPEEEILAPVNRAMLEGAVLALLALGLVGLVTVSLTSNLVRRVEAANRERDVMYQDLIRSAKLASLGEMATGLAHEINNPLAIISAEQTNLADQIRELNLPPALADGLMQSVARCKRQVSRCGEITAKMLQFGRKTETVLKATDLEPVLKDIGRLLERRARNQNVELRIEVPPNLPAAWLDPNELEQVIVNLVNNSLDAIQRGGTIKISAKPAGEAILLEVEDDGAGIPPENLDRVFQPFFTTKPVGKGTGLGLAVVYGIVRGWGGTIDVKSTVGKGTTMSLRIPTAPKENPSGA